VPQLGQPQLSFGEGLRRCLGRPLALAHGHDQGKAVQARAMQISERGPRQGVGRGSVNGVRVDALRCG
jgi:hypothetical protein